MRALPSPRSKYLRTRPESPQCSERAVSADKAGRQIDKPADKLVARYLDAHGDGAAVIETDEVEGVLADVEADGSDRIG